MRAAKWRNVLIGDMKLIRILRESPVVPPDRIRDQTTMNNDLRRTFPTVGWFNTEKHINNIRTVLMAYAEINNSVGYAQGMCFIAFVLYRVYYEDCPKFAVHDTFYSLHTIMGFLRPLFPRDDKDPYVMKWIDSTAGVVRLKLLSRNAFLASKLRGFGYIKLLIVKTLPALFANWFDYNGLLLVWDHIFSTDDIFENTLNIVVGMLLYHKDVYIHLKMEKILELTSVKSFYKASSVVSHAYTLQR